MEKRNTRKTRISYRDPDATESSSDEEIEILNLISGGKKIVKEINLNLKDKANEKRTSSPSKHRGVRRRPSGRYSAEIQHPISKKKVWIGTFDTEQEAAAAYKEKEQEFKKLKVELKRNVVEEEEGSVLDLWYPPPLSPSATRELRQFEYEFCEAEIKIQPGIGISIEEDKALREFYVVKNVEGEGFGDEEEEGVVFPVFSVEELVTRSFWDEYLSFGDEFGEFFEGDCYMDGSCKFFEYGFDDVMCFSSIETVVDQFS